MSDPISTTWHWLQSPKFYLVAMITGLSTYMVRKHVIETLQPLSDQPFYADHAKKEIDLWKRLFIDSYGDGQS